MTATPPLTPPLTPLRDMSLQNETQQQYYERTASDYDSLHLREPEHEFALSQLLGIVRYHGFKSLLDV